MDVAGFLEVIKDRNLIHISLLGVFAQTMSYGSIYTYSSDIAKQAGATAYQLSVINVLLTIPIVLFAYFSANYFLEKCGANKVIGFAFLLMAVYCALVPFAGPIWEFYVLSFFVGLGNGIIFALLTGLSIKDVADDKKTTAMGFFQSVYGIGMTLGPVITGFIIDLSGIKPAFFLLAGVSLYGALFAYRYLERLHHTV
jgi:MFS family permease